MWLERHSSSSSPHEASQEEASDGSSSSPGADTSCWLTEGGIPMTSRPHFRSRSWGSLQDATDDNQQPQQDEEEPVYPMRRVRSRSLGSSVERHQHGHYQHPLVPMDLRAAAPPEKSPPATGTRTATTSTPASCLALSGEWQNLWIPSQPGKEIIATPRPPDKPSLAGREPHPEDEDDVPHVRRKITQSPKPKKGPPRSESTPRRKRKSRHNHATSTEEGNPLWISFMYGLINSTIVLPVLMSFASIIYREQEFAPYMPVLIKLTTISGVVHQVCFSTFSSLPFAVGQVQDAGLIFLSSMATYIVHYCQDRGLDDEVMLATTTVCLSLSTAFLGLGLLLIGQCGLAQYVQMLPTSVVGGYLAYIGWFCGMAGVGLMAGQSSVSFRQITDDGTWSFVLPGILGGILIYGTVRWLRHMAVLPTCILALLVLFYLVVWWTGSSIEKVTEQGWIRAMDEQPHWTSTWDYLRLDLVEWGVLPHLILTEISMILVVAMSSSLDVAAIELELKRPLNYNGELKMVGLSNLISGLTGGYTGSYIFSQSIFSLRAGIRSRAAGYVLAATQFLFFLVPFPILAYVPNFFFGSLLSMICVDLMYEWLWDVRHKVTPVEYLICLGTFVAIQFLGVEFGILLGLVMYLVCRRIGLRVGDPRTMSTDASTEEGPNNAEGTALLQDSEGEKLDAEEAQLPGYGAI